MARRIGNVRVETAIMLLVVVVVVASMCASGADAARRLVETTPAPTTLVAAVAPLPAATRRAQIQMEDALVREGRAGEDGVEAAGVSGSGSGSGSVAASKRLSPGGPDPQHP
ncbi:hypothetical protein ACP4OV_024802 [Aristida adscensionis]